MMNFIITKGRNTGLNTPTNISLLDYTTKAVSPTLTTLQPATVVKNARQIQDKQC